MWCHVHVNKGKTLSCLGAVLPTEELMQIFL